MTESFGFKIFILKYIDIDKKSCKFGRLHVVFNIESYFFINSYSTFGCTHLAMHFSRGFNRNFFSFEP